MSAGVSASASSSLRFNTLDEWLKWQESLHATEIELGLERCRQVADRLGLLKPPYTVVSVAGTNGKGSSVGMLDSILRKSGYRVGCYTSPHLIRYNERIHIDGEEASDTALCRAFERINDARGDISLTYFEFGTLAALELCREAGVDIAVLEVGLGGRLDAVNVLDADCALVTAIDLDHQNYLGDTRELIAVEKAGIYRPGRPAVCSDPQPPTTLHDYAHRIGAQLSVYGQDFYCERHDDNWDWHSGVDSWIGLPYPDPFNSCQIQNATGVLMVLHHLRARFPVQPEAVRQGLVGFRLNGRFQVLPGEFQYVLDVAHNAHAARMLLDNLRQLPCTGRTHVIIGMLRDKDRSGVFKVLNEVADSWHTISLTNSRGTAAEVLTRELESLDTGKPISSHDDMAAALAAVRAQAAAADRVLITGSFLTVGAALRLLEAKG
ncbi:dihydrofolate synthase/folylpolyglutamate synthase [Methylohalomonas lacus]|uniref:Dihydrofolate synthase/folylpolyglutamate synthase n=1 Tax=Methylohalomonas lacus TaxID=398773 RepID=A0AAE3L1Z7_9GAMM|nr:bifunctional tetrahydrofolate synthase/dihydrofolate synthase [Methylohalomonas lacus]MCS3903746.1 dihydrofolate synthase/folylpolyglutamate synthase [Methylohalomonas lacus]